jgi:hypothetical protein
MSIDDNVLISHYCSFRTAGYIFSNIAASVLLFEHLEFETTDLTFKAHFFAYFVMVSGVECSIPPRHINSSNAGEHELDR